jgi:hypothetical protein
MDRGHEAPMDVDDDPSKRTPFVALWEENEQHGSGNQKNKPQQRTLATKELLAPPQTKVSKHKKKLYYNPTKNSFNVPSTWIKLASSLYNWTRISIYWLHHILQLLLISFAIYFVLTFAFSFRRDLYSKASLTKDSLVTKQRDCHRSFLENHCHPVERRPPALALKCEEWKECSERDMDKGFSWSRIFMSTMAESVEGFLEQVSWRSMVFLISLVAVYLLTSQQKQPTIRIVQDYHNGRVYGGEHNHPPLPQIENKSPFLLLTDK